MLICDVVFSDSYSVFEYKMKYNSEDTTSHYHCSDDGFIEKPKHLTMAKNITINKHIL